eukprot:4764557-Amphidinium_carterae.1
MDQNRPNQLTLQDKPPYSPRSEISATSFMSQLLTTNQATSKVRTVQTNTLLKLTHLMIYKTSQSDRLTRAQVCYYTKSMSLES